MMHDSPLNKLPEEDRQRLTQAIIDVLNCALMADPRAIRQLFEPSVACNQTLFEHPTVQVNGPPYSVRMIGVLNGVLDHIGLPRVAEAWEYSPPCEAHTGRLVEFRTYKPRDTEK